MIEDIFTNLAKDINDSVQKVLSSQEFSDLKSTVRSSFSQLDQGVDPASPEEQARRREAYRRQQELLRQQQAQRQQEYQRQQQARERERARQQEEYRRQQQERQVRQQQQQQMIREQQRARQQQIRQQMGAPQPIRKGWNYVPGQQMQPQGTQAGRPVPRSAEAGLVPIRSGGAIVQSAVGSAGAFLFGMAALKSLAQTLAYIEIGGILRTSVLGSLCALCVLLLIVGMSNIKRAKRYKNYRSILRGQDFCKISDIASTMGVSEKRTVQDLERMLERRYLPEGYFDERHTCIILNKPTYQQYLATRENARQQQLAAEGSPSQAALAQMKAEGSRYIWRIREINADLPEAEISERLDELAEICQKIFTYIEEHPEKLSDIRKFMSYYLPTTLKLLEAYRDLEQRGLETAEVKATKAEIKSALKNIKLAFENLYADLVKDDLMDLSADISVLEAMLTQEGLMGEEDFAVPSGKAAAQPAESAPAESVPAEEASPKPASSEFPFDFEAPAGPDNPLHL